MAGRGPGARTLSHAQPSSQAGLAAARGPGRVFIRSKSTYHCSPSPSRKRRPLLVSQRIYTVSLVQWTLASPELKHPLVAAPHGQRAVPQQWICSTTHECGEEENGISFRGHYAEAERIEVRLAATSAVCQVDQKCRNALTTAACHRRAVGRI
jgi:hypothetical protein